ncbi:NAD-dependent epimerase/dehydratase family protein [Vibrio sp. MA40-2]|uniref:NAD-dependent epimerase/dehydratase family protein n=1 Tax=Vibrio sp. MA40-2 TaxID=3391828 RepID=UPI0039A42C03
MGAGWLGQPLATQLLANKQFVYATRRSAATLEELRAHSIPCFQLSLQGHHAPLNGQNDPDYTTQIVQDLIDRDIETVIGVFPPGFRQGGGEGYANNWKTLVDCCRKAKVNKIIMVSSTSVYPDTCATMIEADASYEIAVDNDDYSNKSRIMLTAEQSVLESKIDYVILRCSGLFGPNRHPARFVAKLSSISNVAPVNMVHLDDVVNAIEYSLTHINNQIVNVSTPNTVTKYQFYQQALQHYAEPITMPETNSVNTKRISAEKLLTTGFTFKFDNVLDALAHC